MFYEVVPAGLLTRGSAHRHPFPSLAEQWLFVATVPTYSAGPALPICTGFPFHRVAPAPEQVFKKEHKKTTALLAQKQSKTNILQKDQVESNAKEVQLCFDYIP